MSKKAPVASGLAPSPEPARKSPSVNVLLPPAPQKTGDVQPEVIGETAVNTISVPGTADDWEEDGPEEIIVPTVAPVPAVAPVATPVTPVEPHVEGEEEEGDEEEDVEAPPPPPPAEDEEPEQLPVDPCIGPDHRKRHQFKKHEICIPDKARKPAPPPKVKPWYLQKKPDPLEKRQDSRIAFLMPKQQDPQVIALRKTNKMVQKLIKYMKKSWKVRINRKQAPRELEFRTLASVYTSKPEDWLDKIRQREDAALETGFFSAMDIPYEAHIDMELDTALLVFKNLPPDLKITVKLNQKSSIAIKAIFHFLTKLINFHMPTLGSQMDTNEIAEGRAETGTSHVSLFFVTHAATFYLHRLYRGSTCVNIEKRRLPSKTSPRSNTET